MLKGLNRIEWRVLSISLLLMMACAFLLANEKALNWLGLNNGPSEVVARVLTYVGDVRVQSENSRQWSKVRREIRLGDSLFVGEDGRMEIELSSKARLEVPSKAILRFRKMEGIAIVDMIAGTFVWRFSGPQAVAVKGARATLAGGSEAAVEIVLDGVTDEHRVRTLTGEAQLQIETSTLSAPQEGRAPEVVAQQSSRHFYLWRLQDFFTLVDQTVKWRSDVPFELEVEIQLNWEHPSGGPFNLQLARTESLTGERRFYSTVDPTFTLERAFLGDNYWRVAFADHAWSVVQKFTVEGRFLDSRVEPAQKDVRLNLRSNGEVLLRWNFSSDMAAYVAELNPNPNFPKETSQLRYLTAPEFVQDFSKPGVLYVRMRGLNSRQELTDWSAPMRVQAR